MTNEKRASLIKNILLLLLAGGVVAGVFLYKRSHEQAAAPKVQVMADDALEIVFYEISGNPNSDQLAATLSKVQKKYSSVVTVTTVDAKLHPELAKAAGLAKFPHVIIQTAKKEKAFEFQGVWNQPQVERKVDEILRGLKRVGADWRPVVKGMQPARS